MIPGMSMMMGSGRVEPAVFRSAVFSPATSTLTKPSGVAVGDLVLAFVPIDSPPAALQTTGGSAWAKLVGTITAHGYDFAVWWKILNATDVSNAWTISSAYGYGVPIICYSNAGTAFVGVTAKEFVNNPTGQSTLVAASFTPDLKTRGCVLLFSDRDPDATDTIPSGFTSRIDQVATHFHLIACDNLNYAGGSMTFTNTRGAGATAEGCHVLEIT